MASLLTLTLKPGRKDACAAPTSLTLYLALCKSRPSYKFDCRLTTRLQNRVGLKQQGRLTKHFPTWRIKVHRGAHQLDWF